jgi:hypothetical protein
VILTPEEAFKITEAINKLTVESYTSDEDTMLAIEAVNILDAAKAKQHRGASEVPPCDVEDVKSWLEEAARLNEGVPNSQKQIAFNLKRSIDVLVKLTISPKPLEKDMTKEELRTEVERLQSILHAKVVRELNEIFGFGPQGPNPQ